MAQRWWLSACLVALGAVGLASRGNAIPAFARRQKVTCQMCHFRPPELNQDGHDYVRRGLREEPGGMAAMAPMGAAPAAQGGAGMPDMAMAAPSATAPMSEAPVGSSMASMSMPSEAGKHPSLGTPLALPGGDYWALLAAPGVIAQQGAEPEYQRGVIDLWLIGPRDPHWSAAADVAYDWDANEFGWDQAYAQYITRWDSRFESARAGRVLPFAILLNQGGPSMTLSTPVVLSTSPDTGNSWTPATLLRGGEVGAVNLPGWNVYLGAGRPALEDSGDVRAHTDVYASVERLFGSAGNSLGLYGYWGNATLTPDTPGRSFHRLGIFGNLYRKRQKWTAGYLTGQDETADGTSLDNDGWFLLGEQLLSERWAAYARYDGYRQDLVAGGSRRIRGPALGVSWWIRTQVWLTLEAQSLAVTNQETNRTLSAQVTLAF